MSIGTSYSNFLTNQIDEAVDLPLNVQEALETKLVPEELNNGEGRILAQRCIQNLEELSQKVQQFIEKINPQENKKLKIFHSNTKFEYDEKLTDSKDGFKKIGEITFKDNWNTGLYNSYYAYVHGPIFPEFSHEEYPSKKPLIGIEFNIEKQERDPHITEESLQKLVDTIKESFAKKFQTSTVGKDTNQYQCLLF